MRKALKVFDTLGEMPPKNFSDHGAERNLHHFMTMEKNACTHTLDFSDGTIYKHVLYQSDVSLLLIQNYYHF